MSVLNGYGFTPDSYTDITNALAGTAGRDLKSRGYANPSLNQVSTWTVAGSDVAGDNVVTILLPDGTELEATGTSVTPTVTEVAVALALFINTDDAWANVATATSAVGVVTVTYLHAGFVYPEVSTVTPGTGTITLANTQTAGGTRFPAARWCVAAANSVDPGVPALALPDGAAVADLIGVSIRTHGQIVNSEGALAADTESFEVTDMVPVGFNGTIQVTNDGSVAAAANGPVFVVTSIAGGQELGLSRSDAGNSVQLSNNDAYWVFPVAVGERGLIRIRR